MSWEDFPAELRAARKRAKYSQAKLGMRLEVVQPLISAWEKPGDPRVPGRAHILRLAQILDMPQWAERLGNVNRLDLLEERVAQLEALLGVSS